MTDEDFSSSLLVIRGGRLTRRSCQRVPEVHSQLYEEEILEIAKKEEEVERKEGGGGKKDRL